MLVSVRSLFLWLVAAIAVLGPISSLVSAYSDEENIAYVEKILNYLNNNYECTLPTFEEVDKLQEAFEELGGEGSPLVAKSGDYKLVQRNILNYWDSFKKTWSSPVIARSAKRRSFLCKIEDYQVAKFGSSVCTRVKDIRGPLTDHIFEKNPLVRYLKHLETGEVIERPPTEAPTTPAPTTLAPATEAPTTLAPVTEAPQATEEPTTLAPVTEAPLATEAPEPELEQETEQVVEQVVTPTEEPTTEESATEQQVEPPVDGAGKDLAQEETQMNDVKHNSLEYELKLEVAKYANNRVEINVDLYHGGRGGDKSADDEQHDALDDIPVPASDDKGGLEMELSIYMGRSATGGGGGLVDTTEAPTEAPPRRELETVEPEVEEEPATTTALPMFDEHGAEYIEAEYDDARLDQLVRVPKKDWAFDPIFGYFKWPDECNSDARPSEIQLDDSFLSLDGVWAEFTQDPYAYDEKLEAIRRTTTTTPKPKINAAWLRKQKKNLVTALHDEGRRAQMFGWDANNVPLQTRPFDGPVMPELKRDRWLKLADNNYCKLGFNQARIVDSTKSGYKAVKSFFKGHGGDAFNSRRRLLSKEQQ